MKIQNTNRRSKLSMLAIVLAMLAVLACAFTVAVAAENDSTGAPKTIEIGVNELTIGLSQNSDGMYQKVYDGNGNLLKEKTIHSTYKSRPRLYIIGPSNEQEIPDSELPDDLPDFELPDDFWDDVEAPEGSEELPDDSELWP